jgi:hypothetical protein
MSYLGKGPEQVLSGVASKDTFTGDGSTTTFDITTDIPAGGENDIQVFVDNVRQEPGSSASYTVGLDGSSLLRRITFNVAPEATQTIYVINPRRIEAVGQIPDNTITTSKIQDLNVTTGKIAVDAITEAKIADGAIENEHLNTLAITGQTELAEVASGSDILLIYDASSGTLKKIQSSNVGLQSPTFSSVSPTNILATTGTTTTLTITGTGFTSGSTARLIGNTGHVVEFTTVTRDSTTQITAVATHSDLLYSNSPYGIQITNGTGISITSLSQVDINASPTWVTSSGSLGTIVDSARTGVSLTFQAYDPDSTSQVDYEIISGALPAGLSLSNDGTDVGTISGNATAVGSDTTSSFTIRAYDSASNFTDRAFSIQILAPVYTSFTSSGTFSVPAGVTSVNVLVVAGGGAGALQHSGGGGAGGLIFVPGFTVTPGGTVSVTVGCGGQGVSNPQGSEHTQPVLARGLDSVFGTLTAKGGGYGGSYSVSSTPTDNGDPGGSGGGGGSSCSPSVKPGGTATQPTQPGQSGAYGFGSAGGAGYGPNSGVPWYAGGGGGGAGAAGGGGGPGSANGGAGKSYTIADGTTPVFYAGGGGGGVYNVTPSNAQGGGLGGPGGGGGGNTVAHNSPGPGQSGTPGQANKGGGGGGASGIQPSAISCAGSGGKGIVIVSY